jgi:hypothetical protein
LIALLVGPSGAGKSTVGGWAQKDLGLLWLEADVWDSDGIDSHRLRGQWEAFYQSGDSRRLANTLRLRARKQNRAGTLLTLPSPVILSPAHAVASAENGLTVVVVWGSAENCLTAFMARERQNPRGIGEAHWQHYNRECVLVYAKEDYSALRLETFDQDGTRRPRSNLVAELAARLR